MKQKELALALRGITILGLLCCVLLGVVVLPSTGRHMAAEMPNLARMYWPCLSFFWLTEVPVLLVLVLVWRMAGEIGRDNSFCYANARRLKWVCVLAVIDTAAYLGGGVALAVMRLARTDIMLRIFGIMACGVAIAVVAATASHLVYKAAVLKDENDLTI